MTVHEIQSFMPLQESKIQVVLKTESQAINYCGRVRIEAIVQAKILYEIIWNWLLYIVVITPGLILTCVFQAHVSIFCIPSWLSRHFSWKHPIEIRFLSEELPSYIVFTVNASVYLKYEKKPHLKQHAKWIKGQQLNTYGTSSVAINLDRTPSLNHWTLTAEVLWNILQAALFSDSPQNCQECLSLKTHILHKYAIIHSN